MFKCYTFDRSVSSHTSGPVYIAFQVMLEFVFKNGFLCSVHVQQQVDHVTLWQKNERIFMY